MPLNRVKFSLFLFFIVLICNTVLNVSCSKSEEEIIKKPTQEELDKKAEEEAKRKAEEEAKRKNILIFHKTAGFKHQSIQEGIKAIEKIANRNNYTISKTPNASVFNDIDLRKFGAVIFLSTTGDVLNRNQEIAFKEYIRAGGGFVGIHAATDTEYQWAWYGKLVGAYFKNQTKIQKATFNIVNKNHPSTNFFNNSSWIRTDEIYNFTMINENINVLITVDENTYNGGQNGEPHPISWYHQYDGGRSFYSALGHTKSSFSEDLFLNHLEGGIKFALGN